MSEASTVQSIVWVVHKYFDGMHLGEPALLEKCFHRDAYLIGFYHGEYMRETASEWIEVVRTSPKPIESGAPFDMEIASIDISGPTALVKVTALLDGLMYTDYLTLMQMPDGWQIVHKTYYHNLMNIP
jgi:protease I